MGRHIKWISKFFGPIIMIIMVLNFVQKFYLLSIELINIICLSKCSSVDD